MMTFNRYDMTGFFSARSRTDMSAADALKALESRNITGAATVRKSTPTALCQSLCSKAGIDLHRISSHQLAELLNRM